MLGIVTQSDVQDPEFQEMVRREKLANGLSKFDSCFNCDLIHNHVVGAFSPFLSMYPKGREFSDFTSGLPGSLSTVSGSDEYLDPDRIAQAYLERAAKVRVIVENAKELLVGKKVFVFREDNREIDIWTAVSTLLDRFEHSVKNILESGKNKRMKAKALYEIVTAFSEDPKKKSLWPLVSKTDVISPWFACIGPAKTEAQKLYRQNAEVAAVSDIFLKFDERYFIHKVKTPTGHSNQMFPVSAFTDEDSRSSVYGFYQRVSLRLLIREIINSGTRGITINGHFYEEATIDKSRIPSTVAESIPTPSISILTCKFEADSSQLMANILCRPIRRLCKDSYEQFELVFPEEWAISEMELLVTYLELPLDEVLPERVEVERSFLARVLDWLFNRSAPLEYLSPHPFATALLSRYSVYGRGMVNDPKERYETLLELFRRKDWESLRAER